VKSCRNPKQTCPPSKGIGGVLGDEFCNNVLSLDKDVKDLAEMLHYIIM
jgi:hypothetical protein